MSGEMSPRWRVQQRRRWAVVLAAVAVGAVVVGACSSGSGAPTVPPAGDAAPPIIPVTLTATGCSPQSFTESPGAVIFEVTNPPSAVPTKPGAHRASNGHPTEMEVQTSSGHEVNDVEGVEPGTTRSFLVKLEAGRTYRVRCPETQVPWGTITVSPAPPATSTTVK